MTTSASEPEDIIVWEVPARGLVRGAPSEVFG